MRHRPSYADFVELSRQATVVPVYRQLVGDTLTPVSAFLRIQEGDWSFLFESVVGGERVGRYSFLGSGPFMTFQAFGNFGLLDRQRSLVLPALYVLLCLDWRKARNFDEDVRELRQLRSSEYAGYAAR